MTQNNTRSTETHVQNHSLAWSVALHLLPGVPLTILYVIGVRLVKAHGFPGFPSLAFSVGLVLIPLQLGYLLYQGKKRNGRISLQGIVLYREPMPWWQYVALGLPCLIWGMALFATIGPAIDRFLIVRLFSWVPQWYLYDNITQYSQSAVLFSWALFFIFNVTGALAEEFYFHGHLLPRLSHLGPWAPLVNSVLFSLYHFFTPWQNIVRILGLLPWTYAIWWKKSLLLGILLHCTSNAIYGLVILGVILNASVLARIEPLLLA